MLTKKCNNPESGAYKARSAGQKQFEVRTERVCLSVSDNLGIESRTFKLAAPF